MHCISCSNFDGTCQVEEIYASGMLKSCPAYLSGDDVISKTGSNLQIRMESIYLNPPFPTPRIDVYPVKTSEYLGWQGKYMICFDGHGIIRTHNAQSLPAGAIWFAWHDVKGYILSLDNPQLLGFIPLIERRILFDYSVVKYSPVSQGISPPVVNTPVVQVSRKLVIPAFNSERLMEIKSPANDQKERGDQMDLFAL